MKRNYLKIRLLSPLYLIQGTIMLPLLWATSLSFREFLHSKRAIFKRRPLWVLLRVLAKHSAMELGFALPVAMLVPAIVAFCILQTITAFFGGVAFGFILLTLIPVAMPMPSRLMDDAVATSNRFV